MNARLWWFYVNVRVEQQHWKKSENCSRKRCEFQRTFFPSVNVATLQIDRQNLEYRVFEKERVMFIILYGDRISCRDSEKCIGKLCITCANRNITREKVSRAMEVVLFKFIGYFFFCDFVKYWSVSVSLNVSRRRNAKELESRKHRLWEKLRLIKIKKHEKNGYSEFFNKTIEHFLFDLKKKKRMPTFFVNFTVKKMRK